jgi:hypothetical protein
MRRRQSAVALVAMGLLLGCGAIRASADDAQPNPEASKAPPTTSEQGKGEQAVGSKSGQGGKEEPGSQAPSAAVPVFVNGKLDVPGASADSQTVPAKYSQHNDSIDHTPIMAMSLSLTDEQKRAIADSVKLADKPVQTTAAKPAEELPWTIVIHDLPNAAAGPAMPDVSYVRTKDRILLVRPTNRVVVGEITN